MADADDRASSKRKSQGHEKHGWGVIGEAYIEGSIIGGIFSPQNSN